MQASVQLQSEQLERFDKRQIAELSAGQIERLQRPELVQIIRTVHPGFLTHEMLRRIENRERSELQKLVYLCRRCCRQQGY